MFSRVLIANRGEIACRVIRGCREMGCETVAVFSEADARALHTRLADYARLIGPAAPSESYLNQGRLLDVARELACDAVHPGYGFLAENAGFAEAVEAAGLAWIGPPPEAIRAMGLKIEARETARQAGVPVIPGYEARDTDMGAFAAAARAIGYPVLVKASAGGGGKGMRVVEAPERLEAALGAAMREAKGAFGDATVYLEKLIERPRHIEIQVLADTHGTVLHIGERECSIQRRHQKVIEESPSPAVPPELRAEMGAAAAAIARRVGYLGAGTVEFMLGPDGSYYFLEMNTRLQVEHPVTELVYGLDLVHWQLRIAAGERLALRQEELLPRGQAIEARVCAEDAAAGFLPQTGRLELLREPAGPGIRVDSMLYQGLEIGPDYDPLLSKLIVWGEDRDAAIARLRLALADYHVIGVTTNIPFLRAIAASAAYARGETHTGFIPEHLPGWAPPAPETGEVIAAALALGLARPAARMLEGPGARPTPWQTAGAWSNV